MPSVTAKKKCCRDRPRCKKCPVTLKRLADAGVAERKSARDYKIAKRPPKRVMAEARSR